MRRLLAFTLLLAVAVTIPALAASGPQRFKGHSKKNFLVTFTVTKDRKYVKSFRFVSRCPSDSELGNLVPGKMRIKKKNGVRRFSHKDSQFKVSGRFVSSTKAKGTAQNDTGDCHSGKLKWTATALP
jgi:hypothetical protein